MRYQVIHELPDRLRIRLMVPQRPILLDDSQIKSRLLAISGLRKLSFNQHTGSLLVKYNGRRDLKAALFKAIQEMPLDLPRKKTWEETPLKQKKRAVLVSGLLLAAGPVIPLPLKPWLALYGSRRILAQGLRSFFRGRFDAQALDATAIGTAVAMQNYRAAGVVSLMLKIGDYLEERNRQSVQKSLKALFYTQEETAWVKRDGQLVRVNAQKIAADDLVVVRTGNVLPVDGMVVEGEAMVVQASLTGDPFPVPKRPGFPVYAGMAVEEGELVIRAIHVGEETRVSRILQMIEASEELKAEVHSHAERLADRMAPYAFWLSGLTYAFTRSPVRAASVLLVDYSCAIKLATPLAVMAAMIDALKRGVLVKGGRFIEKLSEAAREVAERLGIGEFYAQAFPDQKTEVIQGLKREGHVVAMVGDGVNDSPALCRADVGISMRHGADIVQEAADVILLDGRLEGILEARRISQGALSRIRRNFRAIFGINTALIGLGMTGLLPPLLSAFLHNATTVLVAAGSLRPYRIARGKEGIRRERQARKRRARLPEGYGDLSAGHGRKAGPPGKGRVEVGAVGCPPETGPARLTLHDGVRPYRSRPPHCRDRAALPQAGLNGAWLQPAAK